MNSFSRTEQDSLCKGNFSGPFLFNIINTFFLCVRVKCLGCGEIEGMKFLVSADSKGVVIIWKLDGLLDVDEEVVSSMLMALETDCRITSMAVKPITTPDEEVRCNQIIFGRF